MDLKCWAEGWELPSIDIDCLSVLCYAYFAKVPFNKIHSLPRGTITSTLPELEVSELIYSRAFTIIGIFRREGYNADFNLSEIQNADTLAYLSYIEQKLRPAILYALWLDSENYTKVTRPAYGKICGFPWSLWYPSRIRQSIQQQIIQSKGTETFVELCDIEKIIYKEAHICMNLLEKQLGSGPFFFGQNATTLDAVLYGHLAVLLRAPLASTELQNHLHSCEKLRDFCFRMERFFPNKLSTPTSPKPAVSKKEPLFKSDQMISVGVAIAAMVLYAFASGVLTEKRSKLAQHLGTYKSHNSNKLLELESID